MHGKKRARLNPNEKKFFVTAVLDGVANPFSKARPVLDLKISGMPPETSRNDLVEGVTTKGGERLQRLHDEGRTEIRLYQGEYRWRTDRTLH